MILTRQRYLLFTAMAFAVCLAAVMITPFWGSTAIEIGPALTDPSSLDATILFRARLPRILFAALVGGTLAVSGLIFQAILRNPLASPFTLGVSGGGSLGAVLAIHLGWEFSFLGFSFLPLASLTGAVAVVYLVYLLSRSTRRISPLTLLLAGVVLNFICSALIVLLQFLSDFTQSFMMVRWMMGGLEIYDYSVFAKVAPFVIPGGVIVGYGARYLNVLSAGEEWAGSRGIDVKRTLTLLYFAASLLTGSVIAYSGPIGFVGLVVPHALRLSIGADHRLLLPVSFFAGGAFLIVCDSLARTVMAPSELPVGIVTSILGGPFFLWLLLSRRKELFF